jgi:hypothetical protein
MPLRKNDDVNQIRLCGHHKKQVMHTNSIPAFYNQPYLRATDRLLCYIPNMKFERSNQSNHHYVINGSCAARNKLTTNLSTFCLDIALVSEGDALMCRANYQNQHKSNQIQVWLSTRIVYTSLIQPSQCNRNSTATLYVMAAVADNSDFIPVSEGDVLSLTACNRNLHETISIRLNACDVHSSLMPSLQMQFTLKSKIAITAERKQSTFIGCITAVSEGDVLQAPSRNIRDLQLVRLDARDVHPSSNQPLHSGTFSIIAATATSSMSMVTITSVSEGDVLLALDRNLHQLLSGSTRCT